MKKNLQQEILKPVCAAKVCGIDEVVEQFSFNINCLDIDGLDLKEALGRMAGSERLLLDQLCRFTQSQKNFREKIARALRSDDITTALREAHTLKGACGNIGADLLYEKAKELEQYLSCGIIDEKADTMINQLSTKLEESINSISQAIKIFETTQERQSTCMTKYELLKFSTELARLLEELDSSALEKSRVFAREIEYVGLEKEALKLQESVNKFEFDEALTLLNEIVSKIGKDKGYEIFK